MLAGGGAKGAAHIGVLEVLEQMHVPIDCIAGTSMGALVGGGYASGIPAPQMQAFIDGVNWRHVIGGLGQRNLEPIEQKRHERHLQQQSAARHPELAHRNGSGPGGHQRHRGSCCAGSWAMRARKPTSTDLPIPYRAVATDMVSGRMVVLDHGDLATAMRASMAVPGAFAPVLTGNQVLADGGLVRNIPVDVARKLCADVVIVVNLVTPPVKPEQLRTAGKMLGRTLDLMIEANERAQLESLTAQDVRIDVEMGDIGSAAFERTPEAITLGESAARRAAPELARYAVPSEQYQAWRLKVTSDQGIESRIEAVQFAQLERVNPEYLEQLSGIKPGDKVDTEQISEAAQRMSAVDGIESVGYELKGDPDHATLEWLPVERSWGPDFIKVDLGAYASASGDDRGFVLYLQHARTWIEQPRGPVAQRGSVRHRAALATSFYQPLDVPQRFFVEPKAFWNRELGERLLLRRATSRAINWATKAAGSMWG